MAYSEGQLNGGADYRCGINIWRTSTDNSRNLSTFYWEVTLVRGNGSAWTNATQYWSANVGGQGRSGTFTIPSNTSGYNSRVVGNGYVDVGHDGEGFRPGFANQGYIDTNHANIGDGGSGDAWVDAPRIPKQPTAVRNLAIVNLKHDSFGVNYIGPADWRGSTPSRYRADWFEIRPGLSPLKVWTDYNSQGYTNPRGNGNGPGPALKPNTTYHVWIYAESTDAGESPGASIAATTLSGIYVSDGSAWIGTGIQLSDGGSWSGPAPQISDGDSWELPIPQ